MVTPPLLKYATDIGPVTAVAYVIALTTVVMTTSVIGATIVIRKILNAALQVIRMLVEVILIILTSNGCKHRLQIY